MVQRIAEAVIGLPLDKCGALIGSIELAIDKATSDQASLAQSGKPLFGIQESNAGKVGIFGPVARDLFDS